MKLKMLISTLSVTFIGLSMASAKVDLAQSTVKWTGSKVIGSTHTGMVKIKKADIKYKKGEPHTAKILIDMTSISNEDVKDKKMNKKLVGHLKSNDFFAVSKYKTAEFDVKKIQKATDKFYLLIGDLKIKGKKLPIKVKATVTDETKSYQTIQAEFTFDRTKFGIKYGSGTFFSNLGDKMISDEVKLKVVLKVKKDQVVAQK